MNLLQKGSGDTFVVNISRRSRGKGEEMAYLSLWITGSAIGLSCRNRDMNRHGDCIPIPYDMDTEIKKSLRAGTHGSKVYNIGKYISIIIILSLYMVYK